MLEHNNNIYIGYQMEDYHRNNIQSEDNRTQVDTRHKNYYNDGENFQTTTFLDVKVIPMIYYGVL